MKLYFLLCDEVHSYIHPPPVIIIIIITSITVTPWTAAIR